ncbi:MAG: Gfo/Idh/MocA family oxidoreductase [Lachnospiraceae bacterium]|nr:Gfo/Idh/MocA family oxidoreductase [Lachnospiraceae bacterium]
MKFAILAPGKIACSMAQAVAGIREAIRNHVLKTADGELITEDLQIELYAVASRNYDRAQEFAKQWKFKKAYGSYEEMLEDEAVELVYVASPHSHHYQHAKMCLEHGKNVLLEKAFTVNAKQAEELIRLAEEKKLLLAEAIWTRYMPSRKIIDDIIASRVIGEPFSLTADLGYAMAQKERLQDPKLAGGALLDVGVYPINFALMVFHEEIKEVNTTAVLSPKGVDWLNSVTLTFVSGKMAVLHSSMLSATDRLGIVYGDKGYIEVQNINNCEEIRVYDSEHQMIARHKIPEQINGYEYEVISCMKAINEGKSECEEMPHNETLRVMRLLDQIRREWGMKYPCE